MSLLKSPIISAINRVKDKLLGSKDKDVLPSFKVKFNCLREKEREKERRK